MPYRDRQSTYRRQARVAEVRSISVEYGVLIVLTDDARRTINRLWWLVAVREDFTYWTSGGLAPLRHFYISQLFPTEIPRCQRIDGEILGSSPQ